MRATPVSFFDKRAFGPLPPSQPCELRLQWQRPSHEIGGFFNTYRIKLLNRSPSGLNSDSACPDLLLRHGHDNVVLFVMVLEPSAGYLRKVPCYGPISSIMLAFSRCQFSPPPKTSWCIGLLSEKASRVMLMENALFAAPSLNVLLFISRNLSVLWCL